MNSNKSYIYYRTSNVLFLDHLIAYHEPDSIQISKVPGFNLIEDLKDGLDQDHIQKLFFSKFIDSG